MSSPAKGVTPNTNSSKLEENDNSIEGGQALAPIPLMPFEKKPCNEKLKVTDEVVEQLLNFDSFKMFSRVISTMQSHFKLYEYRDCEEVTNPTNRELMYVIMSGRVSLISDDRIYKRTNFEIKKARKKRKKAIQKIEDEGGEPAEKAALLGVIDDFPYEIINKTEYKIIEEPGTTFGNDRIMSAKNYRPTFGLSCGLST